MTSRSDQSWGRRRSSKSPSAPTKGSEAAHASMPRSAARSSSRPIAATCSALIRRRATREAMVGALSESFAYRTVATVLEERVTPRMLGSAPPSRAGCVVESVMVTG